MYTHSKRALWIASLATLATFLDTTILYVAFPDIASTFSSTSAAGLSWVLNAYTIVFAALLIPAGKIADRFGHRRIFLAGSALFTAASMACGLAPTAELLIAFRILQAAGAAALIPASLALVMHAFAHDQLPKAVAIWGAAGAVAGALGPTLGAILTEYFSWRAVFYVNLPIAAFALIMISGELKTEETRSLSVDWIGLALMVSAIGALQLMLDLGETWDWFASHLIQIAAICCVLCAATFVIRGIGKADNIIDFTLFRDRSFAGANVAIMGFGVAMYGSIAILPLFVQGLLGYPVLESGYLFIPRGIAAGFSMVFTGAVLVNRFDPRMLLACGLILTGTGNVMLGFLDLAAGFRDLAWPGVVSGLGMGLFFVPMSTLAFQNIGPDRQDEASGIYGVTRSIGGSVGIAIVGWQVSSRLQFHWSVLSAGVTPFNDAARAFLAPLGLTPDSPAGAAQLAAQVQAQATMLAFQDAFWLSGLAAFAMLPVVVILQRPPKGATAAPTA